MHHGVADRCIRDELGLMSRRQWHCFEAAWLLRVELYEWMDMVSDDGDEGERAWRQNFMVVEEESQLKPPHNGEILWQ